MEPERKNFFEKIYTEKGYTKGTLYIENGVSKFVEKNDGDIFIDKDNNIYPSDEIFKEENKEFYETLFDFEFDKLEELTSENIEIIPAKLNGEKGKITIKELDKTVEDLDQMVEQIHENAEKAADAEEKKEEVVSQKISKGLNEKYEKAGFTPGYLGNFLGSVTFTEYAAVDSYFFRDNEGNLYPSDKIFNPIYENFYKRYYDFNLEEITKSDDFDIEPANLSGKKGSVVPKGLRKAESPEEKTKTEKVEEASKDKDIDTVTEELTQEEKQETNEESLEGPAITQYKKDTEALRQRIAELSTEENKELDEIMELTSLEEDNSLDKEIQRWTEQKELFERRLNNFIMENPNYQNDPTLQQEHRLHLESIENVKKKIATLQQEKEQKAQTRTTVMVEVWKFREYYGKEISKLENTLNEVKDIRDKFYNDNMGIPLELYGMMNKLEPLIAKMKKDLNEKCGIRSEININAPENIVLIENIKEARKVNGEANLTIDEKFGDKRTTKSNEKEALEQELAEREENIKKYYEALETIKDIENDISNGKLVEEKVENAKQTISSITDESLRNELKQYLEKALKQEKEKEEELKPNPDPVPEEKKQTPEPPKKGKLKVIAKKALNWMKEHKLVTIGLGLALVTALLFAMPTTHMMINSALWHTGKALGWSSGTLSNLHNINLGLSKAVGDGKFMFEGISGAYTLGGAAGAQALYSAAGAKLVGAITGLAGLGAIGTFGKAIADKIKNRKKKGKKPEVKEGPEPTSESKETSIEELEQIKEVMKKMMEQNKTLEEQNEELKAEIERLRAMGITPEEMEASHKMSM